MTEKRWDDAKWINDLAVDPKWEECENRPWANHEHRKRNGCLGEDFVHHHNAVPMRFFWNASCKTLSGPVYFGPNSEGPPGSAHGAAVSLVFDEILAYPVWRLGFTAATVNLNITLRRLIPLLSVLRFTAKFDNKKSEGRKLYLEGDISSPDGTTTYASAIGLWVQTNKLSTISKTRISSKL